MKRYERIPRPVAVEVLPPYAIRVTFDDGVVNDTDLTGQLWGPMFEPLKDPSYFAQVRVVDGDVVWPNGLDLDPLVLHGDEEPARRPQRSGRP
ncbi:MAG TPA: DUF2442 domain-containing protein [Acidimicrobiales bacterium]